MLCTYILGLIQVKNHGTQWGEILPAVLCFVTKFKIILKLQFRDLRKCLVNVLQIFFRQLHLQFTKLHRAKRPPSNSTLIHEVVWNWREVLSLKIILSSLNATITVWHFPFWPVSEISPRSFDVKNNLCSVSSTHLNRSLRKCKDNSSVSRYYFFFFLARCNLVN